MRYSSPLTTDRYASAQVVFVVMMVIKGMSYALLNPTKEILYQVRSYSLRDLCLHV